MDYHYPDARGHFGPYGGVYVAETLVPALEALTWFTELQTVHGVVPKSFAPSNSEYPKCP